MPPEAGSPEDWLRFAESDLEIAEAGASGRVMLEMLCFHAQQAVEKSIKAVLLATGVEFPRTHNLKTLLELVPPAVPRPPDLNRAAGLSDYAVVARYPGEHEPVTEDEYREALRLAEAVVRWAREQIV